MTKFTRCSIGPHHERSVVVHHERMLKKGGNVLQNRIGVERIVMSGKWHDFYVVTGGFGFGF